MNAPCKITETTIDALLHQAEAVQLVDYWRLEALSDEIVALARRAPLPGKIAAGLAFRAWARLHQDDVDGALRAALDALIMAREYGNARAEYTALRTLAVAFERGGLPDESLQLHLLQQQIVAQLGDAGLEASVLNNIGVVELGRDPSRAADTFDRALSVLPRTDANRARRAIISWNAAAAHRICGRVDVALACASDALRLAKEIDSPHWAARAQLTVAYLNALVGRFEEAYRLIEAVRGPMETLRFPVLTAEFYMQYGLILLAHGRAQEAVCALEDAYRIMLEHDLVNLQIDVLTPLAGAYEQIADMAGVISAYDRLTSGVVAQQKRGAELRFAVMKTAFDIKQASMAAQKEAVALQSAALHRLSREFRAPLASIMERAEAIETRADAISPEATRQHLQDITAQVSLMTVMMDDIAELLQPEAEPYPVEAFAPEALAESALRDVERFRLDPARVHLILRTGAGRPLHGTYAALRRALAQLLTNALKFSEGTVVLDLTAGAGWLVATVTDTGIGIPMAEQALVTQPMYRASNSGDVPGAGMGLALVNKLMSGAGATLDLNSTAAGTTATLRWPIT